MTYSNRNRRSKCALNCCFAIHLMIVVHRSLAAETTNFHAQNNGLMVQPQDANYFYNVGIGHYEIGNWDRAISNLTKSLQLDPTNWPAYGFRGCSFVARGDWDKAIEDFSRQIQADPTNALAYVNRGNAYRAKGNFNQAITDLNSGLKIDPMNFDALGSRASIYNSKNDFDVAVQDLNKCLEVNSNDATILEMRGFAYSKMRRYNEATDDLRNAIGINSQYPIPYNDLAWLLATCSTDSIRNGNEAVEKALKACALTNFKKWEYLDTLGAAYAESGDFEKAISYETQAMTNGLADKNSLKVMREHILYYQQKRAWHE
jgi:tetratricopeptide (TPR) repeat protein